MVGAADFSMQIAPAKTAPVACQAALSSLVHILLRQTSIFVTNGIRCVTDRSMAD
jgi:hypothetical protein